MWRLCGLLLCLCLFSWSCDQRPCRVDADCPVSKRCYTPLFICLQPGEVCRPPQRQQCYTQRAGCTKQADGSFLCAGICQVGEQSCTEEGQWEARCMGEQGPQEEVCDDARRDEDCDGVANEGCADKARCEQLNTTPLPLTLSIDTKQPYTLRATVSLPTTFSVKWELLPSISVRPQSWSVQEVSWADAAHSRVQILLQGASWSLPVLGEVSGTIALKEGRCLVTWPLRIKQSMLTCEAGSTFCEDGCVDLKSANAHCGACGVSCTAGQSCCDGVCVSLASETHCGACGNVCEVDSRCCGGKCVSRSDVAHCGTCQKACSQSQFCANGRCVACQKDEHCMAGEFCRVGQCIRCPGDARCDVLLRAGSGRVFFRDIVGVGDDWFVAGTFSGSIQLGAYTAQSAGSDDLFVAKYEQKQGWRWLKVAGSRGNDERPRLILRASGDVFFLGFFGAGTFPLFRDNAPTSKSIEIMTYGHTLFSRVSSSGALQDVFGFGGIANYAGRMLLRSDAAQFVPSVDGGAYVAFNVIQSQGLKCGETSISLADEPSVQRGHATGVIRVDAQGKCVWGRTAGGLDGKTLVTALASGGKDAVFVAGSLMFGALHRKALFGTHTLAARDDKQSDTDAYIAKLSAKGEYVWATGVSGLSEDVIRGVVVDKSGDVLVLGTFIDALKVGGKLFQTSGDRDIFFLRVDTKDGRISWAKQLGSSKENEQLLSVVDGKDGFIYAAIAFTGEVRLGASLLKTRGKQDVAIVKMDPWGNVHQTLHVGGALDDSVVRLRRSGQGQILILGTTASPRLQLGPHTWIHPTQKDEQVGWVWMVKL